MKTCDVIFVVGVVALGVGVAYISATGLSAYIGLVGLYLLGYQNHAREVDKYMASLEEDARHEDIRRTELRVKGLHKHGRVFGGAK